MTRTHLDKAAEAIGRHEVWQLADRTWECACGKRYGLKVNHDHHVAQAVLDALELTEEEQWTPVAEDGTRWKARGHQAAMNALISTCPDDVGDGWKLARIECETRLVSPWRHEGEVTR